MKQRKIRLLSIISVIAAIILCILLCIFTCGAYDNATQIANPAYAFKPSFRVFVFMLLFVTTVALFSK